MESLGLLVGVGSVGKRHLQELLKLCSTVFVVDFMFAEKPYILQDLRNSFSNSSIVGFSRIEEFVKYSKQTGLPQLEIATLADWATTRFQTCMTLCEVRPKHIMFEKILADSILEIERLEKLTDQELQIPSAVNFHLRYSELPNRLFNLSEEYELGPITSMVEQGGARCISTTGVHWLDLANEMFQETPSHVAAKIEFTDNNPRSEELRTASGFAHWTYSGDRTFSVHYDPRSISPSTLLVNWEFARALLYNGNLHVSILTDSEKRKQPITRHQTYDHNMKFQDTLSPLDKNQKTTFSSSYDFLLKNKPQLTKFSQSSRHILSAFINSSSGLTINEVKGSDWMMKKWRVT